MNIETREKHSSILFNEPYKDGLFELVIYYGNRPDPYSLILKFQSVRSVIEAFYQVLINKKEMEPIESLGEEEKKRIYLMTKSLEKAERVKASRAIYLMEKILK